MRNTKNTIKLLQLCEIFLACAQQICFEYLSLILLPYYIQRRHSCVHSVAFRSFDAVTCGAIKKLSTMLYAALCHLGKIKQENFLI